MPALPCQSPARDQEIDSSHLPGSAAGHNPGDDLRQYKIPFQFVFQGTHTTAGGYVDTLDFNVRQNDAGDSSTLRIFSVSNIHGALGDNGQNYKTIATIQESFMGTSSPQILHGCGKQ